MGDLLLQTPKWWYWLIAGVVTAWQARRGWYFQRRFADSQNREAATMPPAVALQRARELAQIAAHLQPVDPEAAKAKAHEAVAVLANAKAPQMESERAIRFFRCLQDALLYAVSSATGFTALLFAYRTAEYLGAPTTPDVPSGAVALLVFFSTVAVVGVAGYLPHFLAQAKLPK